MRRLLKSIYLIAYQCTNCAAACKRCDEGRPCERCIKYGVADSCADGVRKERKKGIKRGPYKRKGKMINPETGYEGVLLASLILFKIGE